MISTRLYKLWFIKHSINLLHIILNTVFMALKSWGNTIIHPTAITCKSFCRCGVQNSCRDTEVRETALQIIIPFPSQPACQSLQITSFLLTHCLIRNYTDSDDEVKSLLLSFPIKILGQPSPNLWHMPTFCLRLCVRGCGVSAPGSGLWNVEYIPLWSKLWLLSNDMLVCSVQITS